jgi:hypothetical protein
VLLPQGISADAGADPNADASCRKARILAVAPPRQEGIRIPIIILRLGSFWLRANGHDQGQGRENEPLHFE